MKGGKNRLIESFIRQKTPDFLVNFRSMEKIYKVQMGKFKYRIYFLALLGLVVNVSNDAKVSISLNPCFSLREKKYRE